MFLRQGVFDGVIKSGRDAEFYSYVQGTLLPVWRSFPGAIDVQALRSVSPENDNRVYPLHTLFQYPDRATMEAALQSPARGEAVRLLPHLLEMFEGRVYHFNSELISAS
jgi:hypothetical protein